MAELLIKKLYEDAIIPTRGSSEAAGLDLYAYNAPEQQTTGDIFSIFPHKTRMIDTGISIAVPKGYFGAIYARSGLASKKGLRPANAVGVVDSDYRGTIYVALHNDTSDIQYIQKGDRIAQLIIQPYTICDIMEVETLDDTERGENGFGSSGK